MSQLNKKQFSFGISIPYASIPGLGKWDRIMTYGEKIQYSIEGEAIPFDFNTKVFCEIIDNFAKVYKARRLGLDYKHLAANPALENGPEQNLAYYSGLCAIENGNVIKLWDHFPDRLPPDPKELLIEIQKKFPRIQDVDGLWGYKCEITPLGIEKLPNCEQISPYFVKNDFDEFGNKIGYNLLNVSAVGVAFQDGTILNLSKSSSPSSLSLSSPPLRRRELPLNGKNSLALSSPSMRKQTMNDTLSPDIMGKLMSHGLMAETDHEAMKAAYAKYMAETEDGPTERKKVAEEYAKCMARMEKDGLTDEEAAEVGDKINKMDKSKSDEQVDMAKMEHEEPDGDEPEEKKMKKMGKFQKEMISELSTQNKLLAERLARLEDEKKRREAAESYNAAVSFAKQAILDGRAPQKAEKDLIELAQVDMRKAERMIAQFDKGTYTVMSKWTSGGSPIGGDHANQQKNLSGTDANESFLGKYLARGATLSQMSKKLATEKGIELAKAQLEILKQHPDLY